MRKKRRGVMTALLCAAALLCTNSNTKAESVTDSELESYIMEEMSAANILGMSISIVNAEKELYCAAFGAAGETESDYVLGSLSKSFTAAAAMQMIEDGDLSLEDKVSDYLTGYDAVADVTVQELLYQTSGIAADERMTDLQAKGKRGVFADANANYNLLGEIIEAVSGLSYEEYISDNILDPLEMTSTYSLRTDEDLSENLLTGYQNYFGFPFGTRYTYDETDDWMQVPSGYLISDAKDMGKYLQMYLKQGGDVLSAESVDAMLYDGVTVSADQSGENTFFGGSASYGMGWTATEADGQNILYHAGRTEASTTMMVLLPEEDLGIVMLFPSQDALVGQKLVEKLEQGIVSLEMGKTAEHIDSRTYLLQHGLLDALMLVVLLLAWLPIFLMGVWSRRRREKMISLPALLVDAGVHLVLPTALLLLWTRLVPVFLVRRFVPDVYYVVYAVIASLYLGAVVKLITGIAIALQNKWHEKKEGNKEKANEEESKESGEKEQKTNEEEGKNPKEKEDKKQEGDKTKKDKE